eukprot:GHVO01009681.1.p1 GENE.GHVO01009681.1~~GHVO01009681.1.p1  ORF type:complete len:382 (+),score=20.51 GHVO01009681.1:172-1317(+)
MGSQYGKIISSSLVKRASQFIQTDHIPMLNKFQADPSTDGLSRRAALTRLFDSLQREAAVSHRNICQKAGSTASIVTLTDIAGDVRIESGNLGDSRALVISYKTGLTPQGQNVSVWNQIGPLTEEHNMREIPEHKYVHDSLVLNGYDLWVVYPSESFKRIRPEDHQYHVINSCGNTRQRRTVCLYMPASWNSALAIRKVEIQYGERLKDFIWQMYHVNHREPAFIVKKTRLAQLQAMDRGGMGSQPGKVRVATRSIELSGTVGDCSYGHILRRRPIPAEVQSYRIIPRPNFWTLIVVASDGLWDPLRRLHGTDRAANIHVAKRFQAGPSELAAITQQLSTEANSDSFDDFTMVLKVIPGAYAEFMKIPAAGSGSRPQDKRP